MDRTMLWTHLGIVLLLFQSYVSAQQGYNYERPEKLFPGGSTSPSPGTPGFPAVVTPRPGTPSGVGSGTFPSSGPESESYPSGRPTESQRPPGAGYPTSIGSTSYPSGRPAASPTVNETPGYPTATGGLPGSYPSTAGQTPGASTGTRSQPEVRPSTGYQPGQAGSFSGYPFPGKPTGPQFSGETADGIPTSGRQQGPLGPSGGFPTGRRPTGEGLAAGGLVSTEPQGLRPSTGYQPGQTELVGGYPSSGKPIGPKFPGTTSDEFPVSGRPQGPIGPSGDFPTGGRPTGEQPTRGYPSGPALSRPGATAPVSQSSYPIGGQYPSAEGNQPGRTSQGPSFPSPTRPSQGYPATGYRPGGPQTDTSLVPGRPDTSYPSTGITGPGFPGQRPETYRPGEIPSFSEGQFPDEYEEGDYSAIPGEPGVDYPIYSEIPETSFRCDDQQFPGYYADVEARCQVFHVCANNRTYDFLCPNGTIFHQEYLVCVWWYQFDCASAPSLYGINENIYDYSITGGEITGPPGAIGPFPGAPSGGSGTPGSPGYSGSALSQPYPGTQEPGGSSPRPGVSGSVGRPPTPSGPSTGFPRLPSSQQRPGAYQPPGRPAIPANYPDGRPRQSNFPTVARPAPPSEPTGGYPSNGQQQSSFPGGISVPSRPGQPTQQGSPSGKPSIDYAGGRPQGPSFPAGDLSGRPGEPTGPSTSFPGGRPQLPSFPGSLAQNVPTGPSAGYPSGRPQVPSFSGRPQQPTRPSEPTSGGPFSPSGPTQSTFIEPSAGYPNRPQGPSYTGRPSYPSSSTEPSQSGEPTGPSGYAGTRPQGPTFPGRPSQPSQISSTTGVPSGYPSRPQGSSFPNKRPQGPSFSGSPTPSIQTSGPTAGYPTTPGRPSPGFQGPSYLAPRPDQRYPQGGLKGVPQQGLSSTRPSQQGQVQRPGYERPSQQGYPTGEERTPGAGPGQQASPYPGARQQGQGYPQQDTRKPDYPGSGSQGSRGDYGQQQPGYPETGQQGGQPQTPGYPRPSPQQPQASGYPRPSQGGPGQQGPRYSGSEQRGGRPSTSEYPESGPKARQEQGPNYRPGIPTPGGPSGYAGRQPSSQIPSYPDQSSKPGETEGEQPAAPGFPGRRPSFAEPDSSRQPTRGYLPPVNNK